MRPYTSCTCGAHTRLAQSRGYNSSRTWILHAEAAPQLRLIKRNENLHKRDVQAATNRIYVTGYCTAGCAPRLPVEPVIEQSMTSNPQYRHPDNASPGPTVRLCEVQGDMRHLPGFLRQSRCTCVPSALLLLRTGNASLCVLGFIAF